MGNESNGGGPQGTPPAEPANGSEPQGTTPPAPPQQPLPQPSATDWQREARKWEGRAKADGTALQKIKDALGGTDPAQVAETAQAERARADRLARENLQLRIGLRAGLPLELAERVRGDDEAAMIADAESLKKYAGPPPAPPKKSDAKTGSGNPPGSDATKPSANDLLRQMVRGR